MAQGDSSEDADASPTMPAGLGCLPGDNKYISGDESDDSGDSELLDDATAASAALQVRKRQSTYSVSEAPPPSPGS